MINYEQAIVLLSIIIDYCHILQFFVPYLYHKQNYNELTTVYVLLFGCFVHYSTVTNINLETDLFDVELKTLNTNIFITTSITTDTHTNSGSGRN